MQQHFTQFLLQRCESEVLEHLQRDNFMRCVLVPSADKVVYQCLIFVFSVLVTTMYRCNLLGIVANILKPAITIGHHDQSVLPSCPLKKATKLYHCFRH